MKKYIFPVLLMLLVISCADKQQQEKAAAKETAPEYQWVPVEKGGVSSVIKLPAQLAAYQEVSIFPKLNAYVKNVLVDVGSPVNKGQLLMVLEAPELEQVALQAREKYTRAQADYSIDKERHQRLLEAARTAGAISPLDLSTSRARMEADSAIANAEKANWQMQQTMLGYLRVTAPFSGVITERNVHPGALVSAASKDKPMLELKEVDHLRLLVDIPENMTTSLRDKDTVSFYVSALQGKRMTGFINRRSMNVNTQYRSERMEIDVPNPDRILTPGMYADVQMYSTGNMQAAWVPTSAVVTSTERKYVLKNDNGKIRKADVSTGNRSADRVEIYGNIHAGDKVIRNANDEIKEQ